jgi:hypothetical protein
MASPAIQAKEKQDKFELAPQFSLLLDRDKNADTQKYLMGVGMAFTYFPLKYVGLDSEYSFYTKRDFRQVFPGAAAGFGSEKTKANYNGPEHIALLGIKAGVRTKKAGLFVKARPGFAVFHSVYDCAPTTSGYTNLNLMNQCSETSMKKFAMDLGGVAELYLPHHTFVRLDAGDTYLKFANTKMIFSGSGIPWINRSYGEDDRHHFQIKLGFGVRF